MTAPTVDDVYRYGQIREIYDETGVTEMMRGEREAPKQKPCEGCGASIRARGVCAYCGRP